MFYQDCGTAQSITPEDVRNLGWKIWSETSSDEGRLSLQEPLHVAPASLQYIMHVYHAFLKKNNWCFVNVLKGHRRASYAVGAVSNRRIGGFFLLSVPWNKFSLFPDIMNTWSLASEIDCDRPISTVTEAEPWLSRSPRCSDWAIRERYEEIWLNCDCVFVLWEVG